MGQNDPVTWQRLRDVFGNPPLAWNVTERQFDYDDEKLKELGRTPHDRINFNDLWYYHHDLAYVELHPELFAHLFPVCLMDWHLTLQANEACSHGDSEFHYGIIQGNVFDTMLTERQRVQVEEVFRDSLLYRIDQELKVSESPAQALAWIARLNSLGLFLTTLPQLWSDWWRVITRGQAVALLQYCSGLAYFDAENPLFAKLNLRRGEGGPWMWENDSYLRDRGWADANVTFLREFLTVDRVIAGAQQAAAQLQEGPEGAAAAKMSGDLASRRELIAARVDALPKLLAVGGAEGWPV